MLGYFDDCFPGAWNVSSWPNSEVPAGILERFSRMPEFDPKQTLQGFASSAGNNTIRTFPEI